MPSYLNAHLLVTPCNASVRVQARVLHMAQSPDGTTIVSAAADETLRFWRILGSPTRSAAKLKMEHSARGVCVCVCVYVCVRVCVCACVCLLYTRTTVFVDARRKISHNDDEL